MINNKEPRYTFGNVQGAMKDGFSVSIGFDARDQCTIEFDYHDQRDGQPFCATP